MVDIYCVLWGDKYPAEYVYRLRDAISVNLTVPYKFYCVTDHNLTDVNIIRPVVDWEGWWQKLSLFSIATGPSLYFDLDCVIVGNLDELVPYTKNIFSAPKNWGQSGHGGIQSSVMAWSGEYRRPALDFDYEKDSKRLWGDQEYLTELTGGNFVAIHKLVCSYKYHCQLGQPPARSSVVTFHGKPDYHECNDAWILKYIQTFPFPGR